ncbi:HAD family phosphatase [Kineosporiaceae bacterium SCSIO 59966]|nr:HAD family phosphatase [Kineosporiaceae bacterium SCSIO 59966]
MVATDLDGTVVRRDQTMSARTVAAVRACLDAGIDVVFVTGRPPRWMGPVVEATGHAGTAVLANGAVVYDLATERALDAKEIRADVVLEAAQRLTAAMPGVAFAVETLAGFRSTPAYRPRWDALAHRVVGDLPDLLADDPRVVKLLARWEGSTSDAMLAVGREVLAGLVEATHSNAADALLEVSAPGVSKAATLAELAARRGVCPADVVAFGDMPNDLAMLQWAGTGYAMADGHPDVLAAADAVAPPCEEDGVAQVLEHLLTQ